MFANFLKAAIRKPAFRMQVVTTTTPHSFTLPLTNGGTFNLTINWGDGSANTTTTAYNGAGATHSYAVPGTYIVSMYGTCTKMGFNNAGDKTLVTQITDCVDLGFTNLDFYGCTNLNKISSKFQKLKHLTTAWQMFRDCTSLGSLPESMFKGAGTKLSTASTTAGGFGNTFRGCTSLVSIPAGFFSYNTAISTYAFYYTFYGCTSLVTIPSNLFPNSSSTTNAFSHTFDGCSSITSLPSDLFQYTSHCTTGVYTSTFNDCTSLLAIPESLFNSATALTTTAFNATFMGCSSLQSIPAALFQNQTLLTGSAFSGTFSNCTTLTTIPEDLFKYNTGMTTVAFVTTFSGCTGITTIPAGLFQYNIKISQVVSTFRNCTGLTEIPNGLYLHNILCTSFYNANGLFEGCTKAKLNPYIFYNAGGETTRFLNQTVNFTNMFYRASYTGTQGTAPNLWACNFGTSSPTRTTCFGGAGNSADSLSNYAAILASKTMTINVAPATVWAYGDVLTGQSSNAVCIVAKSTSSTTYVVYDISGTFTAGEQIGVTGNAAKLAQQTGSYPTFGAAAWI